MECGAGIEVSAYVEATSSVRILSTPVHQNQTRQHKSIQNNTPPEGWAHLYICHAQYTVTVHTPRIHIVHVGNVDCVLVNTTYVAVQHP